MALSDWNVQGWFLCLLGWGTIGAATGSMICVGWGTFLGFPVGCLVLVALYPFLRDDDQDIPSERG
jgi:hypothetical protein